MKEQKQLTHSQILQFVTDSVVFIVPSSVLYCKQSMQSKVLTAGGTDSCATLHYTKNQEPQLSNYYNLSYIERNTNQTISTTTAHITMQRQATTSSSSFGCIATNRPARQDRNDVLATVAAARGRCPTTPPDGRRQSTRRKGDDCCSRLPIVPNDDDDNMMMKTPSQSNGHCEGHHKHQHQQLDHRSQYSPPPLLPSKRRRYNNDDGVNRDCGRFFFRDGDDQRDDMSSLTKRKRSAAAASFSSLPSLSSRLNLPILSFDDVDDDDVDDDDSRDLEKKVQQQCSTSGSTLVGRVPPETLPVPKIYLPRRRGRQQQQQQQRQNHKVLRPTNRSSSFVDLELLECDFDRGLKLHRQNQPTASPAETTPKPCHKSSSSSSSSFSSLNNRRNPSTYEDIVALCYK
mmetsp:Transcript_33943/g.81609  ORF Transcript_33943/g.81609 Transcript_33943/m.81609 type:complete len:401 (+) Transcript_33943:154-1356(+)